MKTQEVLYNLALAQSQMVGEYSIGNAAALDVAMKRVKDWERLKERLTQEKVGYPPSADEYMMICKLIRIMAEMENEDET